MSMKFNGIGDWIFKAGPDGRERVDYDALIAIIEQSTPVKRSSRNEKAIRDGYLPHGRYDYSTYMDIGEAIVRERGTEDAWKIIYGLWRVRSGSMPIGVVNCNI
jgi:hypothetical protein